MVVQLVDLQLWGIWKQKTVMGLSKGAMAGNFCQPKPILCIWILSPWKTESQRVPWLNSPSKLLYIQTTKKALLFETSNTHHLQWWVLSGQCDGFKIQFKALPIFSIFAIFYREYWPFFFLKPFFTLVQSHCAFYSKGPTLRFVQIFNVSIVPLWVHTCIHVQYILL